MNAVPEEFLSKTARVNEASIQPFPNSRKMVAVLVQLLLTVLILLLPL